MGMFDSFVGYVSCPHCKKIHETELQFKWGECMLTNYHIGDYVSDSVKKFEIIDEDQMYCDSCGRDFKYAAISHKGKLYGFSNEKELEVIRQSLQLENKEGVETISISFPKGLRKENPQLFLQKVMEQLQNDMEEERYYIVENEQVNEKEIVDQNICRYSKRSSRPFSPLDIGDHSWYYPSQRQQEPWEEKDTQYTILEKTLQEESNLLHYTIQSEDGTVISDVPEFHLVDEDKKLKILKYLTTLENDILKYVEYTLNDKKDELSFHQKMLFVGFHTPLDYVEYLKKQGKIPKDFTI